MRNYGFIDRKELRFCNKALTCIGFALLVMPLINGCDKPGVIGLDVQPFSDKFGLAFSDTATLISYTVLTDSLRTDEPILNLAGSYPDPVFGFVAASTYFQFSLPANNVNFGSGFTPDSLVLTIGYSGYYGNNPPTSQKINVYRLTDNMYVDSAYYSNDDFAYLPADLAGIALAPQVGDTAIAIKLNEVLFTSADSAFIDNTAFQSFLKGFYMASDTNQPGGILYLNMLSPYTKLTLYYNDSLSFDFLIDSKSARSNRFTHNYYGTAIESQLANTTPGDSLVYVQPMAGVKVKVQFPYLNEWAKIPRAINKAELVFTVFDDLTLDTYKVPDNLFILGAGTNTIITDQYEGASYFGGSYNAANKQYKFNIARYVHEILYKGRENDGIYLIVPNNLLTSGSVVSANRVILGGAKNLSIGMKLKITYTII